MEHDGDRQVSKPSTPSAPESDRGHRNLLTEPTTGQVQAQIGCRALASHLALKRIGASPSAIRPLASHHRLAHSSGSLTTCSGWKELRATKAGKAERPVGRPIGWYRRSKLQRMSSPWLSSEPCSVILCNNTAPPART